jgi:hypothetical protein
MLCPTKLASGEALTMEMRHGPATLLGVIAAACACFAIVTTVDLWIGVPCNGARIWELQNALTAPELLCVERFRANPVEFIAVILSGALGAYVGPGLSPSRSAGGTFIGMLVYDLYMRHPPDWPMSSELYLGLVAGSSIAAALGYAGGWLARYLSRRKAPKVG